MSRRSRSSEPGTDSDGSGQRYAHRVRRRNGSSGSEPTSAAGPVAEHEDMSLFFSPAGSPQEAARIVPAQPLPPPAAVVAPPPPPPPGVVAPPPPPPAEFAPPPPPPAGVQPPAHPPVVPDNDKDVVIAGVRAGISKHEPEALVHMSVRRHRGRDTLGFDMRRTRNQRQLQQEISNNERKSIKSRVLGRIRVEIQEWQRQINPGLNVAGIWEWDRDRDRAILWCHLKAHAESAEHSVSIQIVDGEDD